CRVALEFFEILEEIMPSIRETGNYFRMKLEDLQRHYHFIKEVRGEGLMIGMELTTPGKQVALDRMEQGQLINRTHDVVVRFLPPYIIGQREVDAAVKILAKVL